MKVGVIGSGRVGLVTGACLASLGHDVTCMDADAEKIGTLQAGRTPFHEPELDDLVHTGTADGTLAFVTSVDEAVKGAEVVMICVGRPPVGVDDRSLGAVEEASRAVARAADPGVVVVVKSTVPPGTSGRVAQAMRSERPDLACSVASSPEFLREGHAVEDTLRPERIVVGTDDERAREVLAALYAPLVAAGHPLVQTDPRTSELAKLASNAFLAAKISFANGLARVSELAGADVLGVTRIMGMDPRIGPQFLGAGMGYGGYCLPKDIVTLERTAGRLGYDFGLLREVVRINTEAGEAVARIIEEALWNLEGKRVALLGVAFKAGTDDVRAAPTLALARTLVAEGVLLTAWDPPAPEAAAREMPELTFAEDPYAAALGAHCAVVCTEWAELGELDLKHLAGGMAERVLVDARNALDPEAARAAGFRYVPIGRSLPD
jgi:UDPglucose 6-dehydrogenase